MPARFTELIVDCKDPHLVGGFWQQVLGWEISERADDYLELTNPEHPYPTLLFGQVPDQKIVKNRLHIDVSPRELSQEEEVERIIGLGARRIDIGQGDTPWVVLGDPEGNEFCILRTPRP
jgi:hypothetical protein